MNEIIDTLGEVRPSLFSQLDLSKAYWQVFLDDESKEKTAFSVGGKTYQYRRLTMGLCGAAQHFQRILTETLREMLFVNAIVYLDDVLILSRNFEDHLKHLHFVFTKFRDATLRLNPKKCTFCVDKVKYLGNILSHDGFAPDPSKVNIIMDWPTPKTAKQVKSLLGICNFNRRYIMGYSQHSAALRMLLPKDVKFRWEEAEKTAFQDLKQALTTAPVFQFPDTTKQFVLTTDASLQGLSWVLGQRDEDGREYAVSFGGRGLRSNELR